MNEPIEKVPSITQIKNDEPNPIVFNGSGPLNDKITRSLNTPVPPIEKKNPVIAKMSAFSKSVAKIQYLLMGGVKPEGVFSDDEESSNNSDNNNAHVEDLTPTIIHRSPRKTGRKPPTIPKC